MNRAKRSRIEQNKLKSKLKLKPKFKVYIRGGLDTQRARVAGPLGFEPKITGSAGQRPNPA